MKPVIIGGVEVVVEGSGPAMLVLHGTPGDWRQCESIARAWSDTMTVIRPSRPGYGRTPLSLGATVHEQAVLMDGLLEELGVDEAVVMGVSGGGPFALALAQDFPDRVRGLVLCCSLAANMPLSARGTRMAKRAGRLDRALTPMVRGVGRLRTKANERQVVRELTELERREWANLPEVRKGVAQYARDTTEVLSLEGIRNDCRQFLLREELTCFAPTLIVHGSDDQVVPLDCAELHAATIPDSRLVVLPERTHALPITAAKPFDSAVRSWMAQSVGARG